MVGRALGLHDQRMQLGDLVEQVRRQGDILHDEAGAPQVVGGLVVRLGHVGMNAGIEIAARDADGRQRGAAAERGFVVGHRHVERAGVGRIGAGQDAQQTGAIARGPRQRADHVERVRHRHGAAAADPAVGRHQAGHARNGGRAADRAAGVRTERGMDQAAADGDAGAARGAATEYGPGSRDCGTAGSSGCSRAAPWRTRPSADGRCRGRPPGRAAAARSP